MRRRYIALQPTSARWRFAVATSDRNETTLSQAGDFERDVDRPLSEQLSEIIGPLQFTDRLACALPASSALVRWLAFPFSDPRKVAAAVPPEVARQLPCSLEERVIFHQQFTDKQVLATAINKQLLETCIAQFDDNREPLGYLGLAPLCYAAALDWTEDGLLLCAVAEEVSLARYQAGQLVALRILPQTTSDDSDEIIRQTVLLSRCSATVITHLRLLGLTTDDPIAQQLEQAGFNIETVRLSTPSGELPSALTSTACLALTAINSTSKDLNLRSGSYKLKNDWQALKRRMWIGGGLLLCTLLVIGVNGTLQYQQRAAELQLRRQQMTQLYQQAFPGETLQVAAPLQLQSKLKELQKKSAQFSTGTASALQLLLVVSDRIATDLSVDISEYLTNDEGLRLTGKTTDFDALSKLLASLQGEPLFKDVRILDSKQALDGKQVDFQLQIQLAQGKGE